MPIKAEWWNDPFVLQNLAEAIKLRDEWKFKWLCYEKLLFSYASFFWETFFILSINFCCFAHFLFLIFRLLLLFVGKFGECISWDCLYCSGTFHFWCHVTMWIKKWRLSYIDNIAIIITTKINTFLSTKWLMFYAEWCYLYSFSRKLLKRKALIHKWLAGYDRVCLNVGNQIKFKFRHLNIFSTQDAFFCSMNSTLLVYGLEFMSTKVQPSEILPLSYDLKLNFFSGQSFHLDQHFCLSWPQNSIVCHW